MTRSFTTAAALGLLVTCLPGAAAEPGTTRGIIDIRNPERPADAVQLVGPTGYKLVPDSDKPTKWVFKDGVLTASPVWDSLLTKEPYRDFRLHVEFNVNEVKDAKDPEADGNSGIYIQKRYELQILNSFGVAAADYKPSYCGSLYKLKKPDLLVSKKAGEWQSYDIVFRAARFDGDKKTENARITAYQNQQLIHDDFPIPHKTGAGEAEGPEPQPIKLQGHHNPVRFRNVWIQKLDLDAKAPAKPNVVFILADDLGYSDLGCYGGEIATPNLDSLASNGLRFTQFHNTARCWPSRGALLTGYYAQQIHRDALPTLFGGARGVRQPWARLLPDYLKPAGYRSYHSGKWHIDGMVLAGGFDRSYRVNNSGNYFTAKGNTLDDKPVTPAADESGYYATTAIADHAIECLKDHAASFPDRPFFQYIAFIAPHFPLQALPQDIAKYRDKYLIGWDAMREARFGRQQEMGITGTTLSPLEPNVGPPYAFPEIMKKYGPGEVNRPLPWSELNDEQHRFQATKMAIHAAMVDRMDQEIGRVVAQLKAMNAFENTIILFASDNGASAEMMIRDGGHDPSAPPGSAKTYLCLGPGFSSACNTPFRRHKTWVHEGGTSTPLVVHWPAGIVAKNELRHTLGHVIDIAPTVLELAGVEKPKEWNGEPIPEAPGRSLVPAFAQDKTIPRDSLWWLHEGHRAVQVGDWKLVAAKGDPWELYDMRTDRAEQLNLAAKMPEKVKELQQAWQQQTDRITKLARKTAPANQDPKGARKKPVKAGTPKSKDQ